MPTDQGPTLVCHHTRSHFVKGYCANGAIQVREVCCACGINMRQGQMNVPHHEVADLDALPVIFDRRVSTKLDDQQLTLW